MVMCEVCGKVVAKYTAIIEGAKFEVCERCAGHGKILDKPGAKKSNIQPMSSANSVNQTKKTSSLRTGKKDSNRSYNVSEEIVDNYAEIIRKEFNKSGKKYKEFANDLNESESYMKKIIQGKMTPTIGTAKKLEKAFGITLIEEKDKERLNIKGSSMNEITLGDMVKIKKKK
jgi:putative transcription factor